MKKTPFLLLRCSLVRGPISKELQVVVIVVEYLLNEIVAAYVGSPENTEHFIWSCFCGLGRVSAVYSCQRCVGCKNILEKGVP